MLTFLKKLKPAAPRIVLQVLAGLIWLGVGGMLDGFAYRWLKVEDFFTDFLLVTAGLLLAALIYWFGFSRLARKNITRISNLEAERPCLFAFQSWTSYPLVLVMISLGIYLRIYSSLPRPLLAIIYIGIGTALFSSGFHYFAPFFRRAGHA